MIQGHIYGWGPSGPPLLLGHNVVNFFTGLLKVIANVPTALCWENYVEPH